MYVWDIKKLNESLGADALAENDQFKYLLGNVILGILPIHINAQHYETLYGWLLTLATTVVGIIYCYKKNNGNAGKNFLARFLSISFVITIRLLVFFSPLLFLIVIAALAFDYGGLSSEAIGVIGLISVCLFAAFYYWRIGCHIGEVASHDK